MLKFTEFSDEILCTSDLCKAEIDILMRQLDQYEYEIYAEKEKYREALIFNLCLYLEIERLKSLQTQKNRYSEFYRPFQF